MGEIGEDLAFDYPGVDLSREIKPALISDLEMTTEARERFIAFSQDPEFVDHEGLVIEIDNMITRNGLLMTVVSELLEESEEVGKVETDFEETSEVGEAFLEEARNEGDSNKSASDEVEPGFTVGSLRGTD